MRLAAGLLVLLAFSPLALSLGDDEGLFPPAGCAYGEVTPSPGEGLGGVGPALLDDPDGYAASLPTRLDAVEACFA